eukprot:391926_1
MGNEQAKYYSPDAEQTHDASFLLSPSNTTYPNGLEYTIYGFIREFIVDNFWMNWDKHQIIPHEIKILLTKYLKCELITKEHETLTLSSSVYHEFEHIVIKQNGKLTVDPWSRREQNGGKLLIKTENNITIKEDGQINVDFCGY